MIYDPVEAAGFALAHRRSPRKPRTYASGRPAGPQQGCDEGKTHTSGRWKRPLCNPRTYSSKSSAMPTPLGSTRRDSRKGFRLRGWAGSRGRSTTGAVLVELVGAGSAFDAVGGSGGANDRDACDRRVVLPQGRDRHSGVAVVVGGVSLDRGDSGADALLCSRLGGLCRGRSFDGTTLPRMPQRRSRTFPPGPSKWTNAFLVLWMQKPALVARGTMTFLIVRTRGGTRTHQSCSRPAECLRSATGFAGRCLACHKSASRKKGICFTRTTAT